MENCIEKKSDNDNKNMNAYHVPGTGLEARIMSTEMKIIMYNETGS